MDLTQPLVLPADVTLVPIRELDAATRSRFTHTDSDFVVSRETLRSPTQVIGSAAATLVGSFRTARTIVDAVIAYGQSTASDPERTLVEAYPMLRRLVDVGLLVPDGSRLADALTPLLAHGMRVERWTIGPCIQLFADSEVYQVRDDAGRFYALKIASVAEIEHEASIAPGLVARGTIGTSHYLVLEWYDGIDVERAAVEARSIGGREALLALIRSVLDVYARLHESGIVHGDVHPRNVLVDARGRVRLIDFAFARRLAPGAPVPPRAGVAFYTEPELADTPATVAGEQYALGALVYFLATGAHYIDFPLERSAFERAILESPPLPFAARGVEPWPALESVLARALAKEPAARWASVAQMAAALPTPTPDPLPPATRVGALARAMLSDVIGRAERAPSYETAPTASVVSGMAGLAFMLYRVSQLRDSAELLALADGWILRAMSEAGSPRSFDESHGPLSALRGNVSPYHTLSGVHCVRALIANAAGDLASLGDAVDAYIATTSQPCATPELMFGHAGVLIGSALLAEATSAAHPLLAQQLIAHGDGVFATMWDRLDVPYARAGVAHGWAGVLYASLRWLSAAGRDVPEGIVARLDALAAHAEQWGRGLRWPHTLDPADPERHHYLSGWCNGSAGFVHLWMLADRPELAERAAWHVWENLPEAFGSLCCGMAGAAYALLAWARDDHQWRRRAITVADRAARAIVRESDSRDGLWYGEPGVALLAADLEAGGAGCMPFFASEGWQM